MRRKHGCGCSAATPDEMKKALLVAPVLVLAFALGFGVTGASVVPATHAGLSTRATGPNDVKPLDCSGITVSARVSGSGIITGTGANELALGGTALDTISGLGGDDCIVGGGGGDVIDGGLGTDVCVGGPGTDMFLSCETQVQ
jgi:Ca2+-binding RTX toxin-like protein